MDESKVYEWDNLQWTTNENHIKLFQKELMKAEDANHVNIELSSILYEKVGYKGSVIPHYHDVCEIIYITKGRVKFLQNNTWKDYKQGDTIIVPANVIHSVANVNEEESEQISIFLPISQYAVKNEFFNTNIINDTAFKEELGI